MLGACLLFGCSRGPARSQSITVAGSTSVQPFAEKLTEIYMEVHPDLIINVQGGGSTAGITSCRSGAAQIGTCSRELRDDEKDLQRIVIAYDGIAIIVHPGNPTCQPHYRTVAGDFFWKAAILVRTRMAKETHSFRHPGGRLGDPGCL